MAREHHLSSTLPHGGSSRPTRSGVVRPPRRWPGFAGVGGVLLALILLQCRTEGSWRPDAVGVANLLVGVAAAGVGDGGRGGGQSLAERLQAVQAGTPLKVPNAAPSPPPPAPFKPFVNSGPPLIIPVVKDLVAVAARADPPKGDWEWVAIVTDISAASLRYHYASTAPKVEGAQPTSAAQPQQPAGNCEIVLDIADLATARSVYQRMCETPVMHHPGMTEIVISTAVLNELRAGHAVEFHMPVGAMDFVQIFVPGGEHYAPTQYAGGPQYPCTLTRQGTTDFAVPVLVNNQPVELQALKFLLDCPGAVRTQGEDGWHFVAYVLDQPSYPMLLASESTSGSARFMQMIKIFFPVATPAGVGSPLEVALAKRDPVPVYGIYFDFNSDAIKPESEKVLVEIATILKKNPEWRLSVSGHTDNIGAQAANLALSQRRTAAVKQALVSRFQIAPERLVTDGFGASRPIAPNDTYEGRARNRRVELQRL